MQQLQSLWRKVGLTISIGPSGKDCLRVFQINESVDERKQVVGDVWNSKIAASMYF